MPANAAARALAPTARMSKPITVCSAAPTEHRPARRRTPVRCALASARSACRARARDCSATLCGQPMAVGSFIGPSSITETNSSTMKLSSSVVTTSSTPKRVLQQRRAEQQQRAGERARPAASREQQPAATVEAGAAVQAADGHGGERAGVELAFGADVEEPRPERDGGGQPGEDQRRGAGQRLAPARRREPKPPCEEQRVGCAAPARRPTARAARSRSSVNATAPNGGRRRAAERAAGARSSRMRRSARPCRPSPGRSLRASMPARRAARRVGRGASRRRGRPAPVSRRGRREISSTAAPAPRAAISCWCTYATAPTSSPRSAGRDDQDRRDRRPARAAEQRAAEDQLLHVAAGERPRRRVRGRAPRTSKARHARARLRGLARRSSRRANAGLA